MNKLVGVCLALLVASPVFAAGGFDQPLSELFRTEANVSCTFGQLESLGTQDGQRQIRIDVPGTPQAAWVYWLGESRQLDPSSNSDCLPNAQSVCTLDPTAGADPSITLINDVTGASIEFNGEIAGRRSVIFSDDGNNGGEFVSRAQLSAADLSSLFTLGENLIRVDNFNERTGTNPDNPNERRYSRQYGVSLVVVYEAAGGGSVMNEIILLDGADIANQVRFGMGVPAEFGNQANSDVICFDFAPLQCDALAALEFSVGGITERIDPAPNATGGQTFFQGGSGGTPGTIVGTGQLLEVNLLPSDTGFFQDTAMASFDGSVMLQTGDTFACFQHELFGAGVGELFAQNYVTHAAALGIDRDCANSTVDDDSSDDDDSSGDGASADDDSSDDDSSDD